MFTKIMKTCKKAVKANLLRLILKETCSTNKKIYEKYLENNM